MRGLALALVLLGGPVLAEAPDDADREPVCSCRADFDHDCGVGLSDLGVMWSELFEEGPHRADLNDSGAVNFADLGLLLRELVRSDESCTKRPNTPPATTGPYPTTGSFLCIFPSFAAFVHNGKSTVIDGRKRNEVLLYCKRLGGRERGT